MSQQIDIPGVGLVEFPDSMSDADVSAAAKKLHDDANRSGSSSALGIAAVPAAANLAERVATSPTLPATAATIGRITGAVAPAAGELATGNLPAAIAMLGNAGKTSWLGGKSGWFTGKLLQRAAAPVASGLEKIAPAASVLSGAAGIGDLAQMAEPNRKDIGFLGIGGGTHDPNDPALLNAVAAKLRALLGGS